MLRRTSETKQRSPQPTTGDLCKLQHKSKLHNSDFYKPERPAEVWKSGIHSNATNMLLAEAFFSKAELSRAEQHNAFDQNSPFSAFLDSTKIDF